MPPPQVRIGCSPEPWLIRDLTSATVRVAGSPLAAGTRSFVQIDIDDRVALGLTVTAGAIHDSRGQLLTACSADDRGILAIASWLAALEPSTSDAIAAAREVPRVT